MKINILSWSILFLIAIGFSSCEEDPLPGTVNINFDYRVGDKALELNQMVYTAPAGYEYEIVNNKYYVSRVKLIKDDNSSVELALAHLRDIHDETTRVLSKSNVDAGSYTGLELTFGLNIADNDQSVLPNTVENQNMWWPAGLTGDGLAPGFHYMKYEGRYLPSMGAEAEAFNLHLGPTFGNNNFFTLIYTFDKGYAIEDNTLEIDLVCDLQEWLQNPLEYDYEIYGQSIMPQQLAQEELKANGSTVFIITSIETK